MRREEFLNLIVSKCDFENTEISEDMLLEDCEEWDSLALITTMSLFKTQIGKTPTVDEFNTCKTFKDILDLAEDKYEK